MAAPGTAEPGQACLTSGHHPEELSGEPPPSGRLHIPEAWREAAATILQERLRVILLLGCPDAGKSSYARFLAGELAQAGQRVAFVDADIGQKSIGPPATVTLAHIDGAGESFKQCNPQRIQSSI